MRPNLEIVEQVGHLLIISVLSFIKLIIKNKKLFCFFTAFRCNEYDSYFVPRNDNFGLHYILDILERIKFPI